MNHRKTAAKPRSSTSPDEPTRRARALLLELLKIPGVSGNEQPVIDWITARLLEAGAPESAIVVDQAHRRSRLGGSVGNLALVLPGTLQGPRRMLSAHVDTVPLCAGASPVVKGNWIVPADPDTALGGDNRCGVAVVLGAALEILANRLPHPPVTFLFTVQEEVGLVGSRNLKIGMLGKPRLAFNYDGGSSEKLTVGATGGYRMDIRIEGIASHAGNAPEFGVSAVAIASLAIARLHQKGWHGLVRKGKRQGTSNFGVIQGGEATNVVTPLVQVRAEARSHDPAFRMEIVDAIQKEFAKAAADVKNVDGRCGKVLIEGRLDYESFLLAKAEPCVTVAEQAIRSEGGSPIRGITNGGVDANWFSVRGIPTVTLGCGQSNPHTVEERICLPEFDRGARVALRLATARESEP
ncbi:MAG: M20/M25/M40 family metallo-hydrolase [Thermoguttaceae bacterium]